MLILQCVCLLQNNPRKHITINYLASLFYLLKDPDTELYRVVGFLIETQSIDKSGIEIKGQREHLWSADFAVHLYFSDVGRSPSFGADQRSAWTSDRLSLLYTYTSAMWVGRQVLELIKSQSEHLISWYCCTLVLQLCGKVAKFLSWTYLNLNEGLLKITWTSILTVCKVGLGYIYLFLEVKNPVVSCFPQLVKRLDT